MVAVGGERSKRELACWRMKPDADDDEKGDEGSSSSFFLFCDGRYKSKRFIIYFLKYSSFMPSFFLAVLSRHKVMPECEFQKDIFLPIQVVL